jgi:hypothetical protein
MSTSLLRARQLMYAEVDTNLTYDWHDGPLFCFTVPVEPYPGYIVKAFVQEIPTIADTTGSYLYSILDDDIELYLREGRMSVRDAILHRYTTNFIVSDKLGSKERIVNRVYLDGDKVEEELLPAEDYYLGEPN